MNTQSKAGLVLLAALLAACSENATAPQPMVEAPAASEGSMQSLTGTDTIRFAITIDPSRQTTFYLGAGNSLVFPAGSLCSLNSSYGNSEWDKPCTKATSTLVVNTKAWLDRYGKARIEFDKHVRFVPSNDPAKWVVISFADMQASLDPFFNILYCPSLTSSCYNEAKKDPSLLTVRNPLTGKVTRRIKHFSGYNVAAGREGEEDSNSGYWNLLSGFTFSITQSDFQFESIEDVLVAYPRMSDGDAESMMRVVREAKRSGYILASG